jgi:hypothetical protein
MHTTCRQAFDQCIRRDCIHECQASGGDVGSVDVDAVMQGKRGLHGTVVGEGCATVLCRGDETTQNAPEAHWTGDRAMKKLPAARHAGAAESSTFTAHTHASCACGVSFLSMGSRPESHTQPESRPDRSVQCWYLPHAVISA